MDYSREKKEAETAYIYRICGMKDVIGSWKEVADIINKELGYSKGESAYRKMYQSFQKIFETIQPQKINEEILDELAYQKMELRKEKQKLFDERAAYNEMCRKAARGEEIQELLINQINSELPQLKFEVQRKQKTEKDLLVSLNDIHYGAVVSNSWNKYSPEIFEIMLAYYLNRIHDIAEYHEAENCYVWMNGDAINGSIHETSKITNKEVVTKQIMHVSELIANFLFELSKMFNNVYFVGIAGNHSRLEKKESAPIDERMDDLIEWYAKARLSNIKNVHFDSYVFVDPTMYLFNIRGLNYLGVHGDYDKKSDNIQALRTMAGVDIYAVLLGHMHHNATETVQGIKKIMAGSFLGMDDYCVQHRIYGEPEQMVCVVNNEGILCHYDITFKGIKMNEK